MSLSERGPRGASEREPDVPAAYQSALRSLAAREMSRLEVARTLRRKGHPEAVVSEVVERLRSEGWVDDLRFACAFLRYRQRSKPASIQQLRAELAKRGCGTDIVEEALSQVCEDAPLDDLALALAAIGKRRGSEATNPERLLRFLARRGFSFDVARRALAAADRAGAENDPTWEVGAEDIDGAPERGRSWDEDDAIPGDPG